MCERHEAIQAVREAAYKLTDACLDPVTRALEHAYRAALEEPQPERFKRLLDDLQ